MRDMDEYKLLQVVGLSYLGKMLSVNSGTSFCDNFKGTTKKMLNYLKYQIKSGIKRNETNEILYIQRGWKQTVEHLSKSLKHIVYDCNSYDSTIDINDTKKYTCILSPMVKCFNNHLVEAKRKLFMYQFK